ncbi:MAG TPA: FlgT C-terminal domain-containing protein [Verrucomicrobiae bacterium]|nr:FlgT C-terminal domain-containing protein [Verrucomicrobiae bacterium]
MRKKPLAFAFLFFFLGLLRGICAEDTNQTNSIPVIVISNLSGSKADVPGWQPAVGQGISEMLVESLEESDKKFQVLETAEAIGSQNESKSGASNSTGGATKSAAGGSKMSATNDVTSSEKSSVSSPADSDFTFSGEVMQFTIQTNSSKVGDFISSSPFASLSAKLYTAHVQIEWRLVDSETKKVVKRGITAASASGSDFDMEALAATAGNTSAVANATSLVKTTTHAKTPNNNNNMASAENFFNGLGKAFGNAPSGGSAGGNSGTAAKSSSAKSSSAAPKTATAGDAATTDTETISYGNPTFINSALGKATAKAVTDIIKQLDAINLPEPDRITKVKSANEALKHTSGKVLAVAGKSTIIISLGSKEGLKAGDTLELYQPSDVLDDKSNVVFTDEKLVGEITLQAVQDEKSRASYSGDAQVQQGWTVRAK